MSEPVRRQLPRAVFASVLGIVAASTIVAAGPGPLQKPVIHHPEFHEEGRATAATLEELWNRSDVVIEATVRADRPSDITEGSGTLVFTAYDVTILTVFKSDHRVSSAGKSIAVRRGGGVRDRGDHI